MAQSSCGKCNNPFFELLENTPNGSNYKLLFVQCTKCGTPIGALDYYNIGARLSEVETELKDKIDRLDSHTNTVNQNVGKVMTMLQKLLAK